MSVDLCVVHYNTTPLLSRLLDSLHSDIEEFPKVWTLSIADNDSQDEFVDWMRSNQHKYQIDNLYLNRNIGYSAACNRMAAKTNSEIVCLLNADVWLTSQDVYDIYQIFLNNPEIAILGPKQRDEHGYITHAGIIGTNTAPKHRGWRELDLDDSLYRDRLECVTISGSAYFVRRSVWNHAMNHHKYRELFPDAVGAFLPTPHYFEETWLSYFARHLGYKVFYDGSVSIGHSWHASSPRPGKGFSEADSMFGVSREIFRKACDHIGIERD